MDENIQYYQFAKNLDYPIYLACNPTHFGPHLLKLFKDCHFSVLDKKDHPQMKSAMKKANARMLKIELANIKVMAQIGIYRESDRFGLESTTPKVGHHVYRYRGRALMVYSYATQEWEMGVSENFGEDGESFHDRIILNRYLSWALSPLGVVGLFGLGIDGGVVVLGQTEAMGEALWIDMFKEKIITSLEEKKLRQNNLIVRLDPVLKGQNTRMTRSELLSFLMIHNIFLSVNGPSIPVRQVLQALSKICQGVVHPKQSFHSTPRASVKHKRPDVLKEKQ